MNVKKTEEVLSACQHDVDVDEMTIEAQVKKAIDIFDPYVLCPGEDAPADEYDGESKRIAKKINPKMSKDEIEEVIAKEFTRSFGREFTKEECMSPADKIYEYLIRQGS